MYPVEKGSGLMYTEKNFDAKKRGERKCMF